MLSSVRFFTCIGPWLASHIKYTLDENIGGHIHTVTNLSFLSQLLERVVQVRLQAFIDSNTLMPVTQSAYRQYHSTETAVTKLYNDMLLAADSGQLTALCLLDLTAAFDTVDHIIIVIILFAQIQLVKTAVNISI